jgi:hypothetical protein
MWQPQGYEDKNAPHHLCKLDKALYGLKEDPHVWYSMLSAKLLKSLGFVASKADNSLFSYSKGPCTIFIFMSVDDIIIDSTSDSFTNTLIKKLDQEFALKDLHDLYFLVIEVKRTSEELLMTRERYARDILKRVSMESCKPVSTPMSSYEKLLANDGDLLGPKDATQYRSRVEALQYLTLTRPDLSFSVNHVWQFLHSPTKVHWECVKRILRYMKGTLQYGLKFKRWFSMILSGFSVAD